MSACWKSVRDGEAVTRYRRHPRWRGTGVTTMVVLVDLKEGVSPDDYSGMAELQGGLLGSDGVPPYRYVVTVEVDDFEQLGRYMAGEEMRGLLSELHRFAEATQLRSERFV